MNREQRRKENQEKKRKQPLTTEQMISVVNDMHQTAVTMTETLDKLNYYVSQIPRHVYNEKIHAQMSKENAERIIGDINSLGWKHVPQTDTFLLVTITQALDYSREKLVAKIATINNAIMQRQPQIYDPTGKPIARKNVVEFNSGQSKKDQE